MTETLPCWLIELKDKAARGERPSGRAHGRWLGDFVNEATTAELQLLQACAQGWASTLPVSEALSALLVQTTGDTEQAAALKKAVEPNRVRAEFLRFLALGGDEFAPVHEAGVELHNAFVDGKIDLRGAKCVGRLSLVNCFVDGGLSVEDASLGVLYLQGSRLAGIRGNRARISGSVFLQNGVVSEGEVSFHSAEIGGNLQCTGPEIGGNLDCIGAKVGGNVSLNAGFECEGRVSFSRARIGGDLDCCGGTFAGADGFAIVATGAIISGDVKLSSFSSANNKPDLRFEAKASVWFVSADIGGSLRCSGASFKIVPGDVKDPGDVKGPRGAVLDFSRAKVKGDVLLDSPAKGALFEAEAEVRFVSARIGGDVNFCGASITNENGHAITAQNANVEGSFYFGGGFVAKGEVSLYGAVISKDLSFSGSTFENPAGVAIQANGSRVSGNVLFQPTEAESCCYLFQSFGIVSLFGANCGAMNCSGGTFNNPSSLALDCSLVSVKGQVALSHFGPRSFEAHGLVRFHTAQIGGHLDCSGGRFLNPKDVAFDCQVAKITGYVFLRRTEDPKYPFFNAVGEVTFEGASIGSEFNCLGGYFRNAKPHRLNEKYAGAALNLTAATIAGKLFLGVGEDTGGEPAAVVKGCVDLSAASVRMLVDGDFVNGVKPGLRPNVKGEVKVTEDGKEIEKEVELNCHLLLDNFTYERLSGGDACKADKRKKWLGRQPPEHLKDQFRPQPFEQLVRVLRAMGQNKDADDIALSKRWHAWKAKPWWSGSSTGVLRCLWLFLAKLGELVFVYVFLGYGYRVGRALVILIVLGSGFAWFYQQAFEQGAIIPSDKEIRHKLASSDCKHWSASACPKLVVLVPFKAWLYSADVIIPVLDLGQKKAWQPAYNMPIELPILGRLQRPNLVYCVQLWETVLGWVGSLLRVSFVSGLIKKE